MDLHDDDKGMGAVSEIDLDALRCLIVKCNCLTKTPKVSCHQPWCSYRQVKAAQDRIATLTLEVERLTGVREAAQAVVDETTIWRGCEGRTANEIARSKVMDAMDELAKALKQGD